jgi:coenzyme Q-binding protein COQ10
MPSHKEVKTLNYKPKQILDLVMDIENYPEFLPWCIGAAITKNIDKYNLEADLAISFKGFFQKYSSEVSVKEMDENCFEVKAIAIDGPFKNLVNLWHIKQIKGEENRCDVDFFIDFEFRSKLFGKMITPVFKKATNKMIEAFEKRAKELYG